MKRNYRIEQKHSTTTFTFPSGENVDITYVSEEYSAYEKNCVKCGTELTVRGVMGALRDICQDGKCNFCSGNEPRLETA